MYKLFYDFFITLNADARLMLLSTMLESTSVAAAASKSPWDGLFERKLA